MMKNLLWGVLLLWLSACAAGQVGETRQPTPTFPLAENTPIVKPTAPIIRATVVPTRRAPAAPGKVIAAANLDRLSQLANLGKGNILSMDLSPAGTQLAFSTRRGISIYDAESLGETRFIEIPGGAPKIAFAADGLTLAAANWTSQVTLWRPGDGALIRTFNNGDLGLPLSLAFVNNGRIISIGTGNELNLLWNVETGKLEHRWYTSGASAMGASTDGYFLATSNWEGSIFMWSAADGKSPGRLFRASEVQCIQFSPDSKQLAAGYGDNTVALWNVMDGKVIQTLKGHTDRVTAVAFSADGQLLASAGWDATVRLWNTSDGRLLRTLDKHHGRVQHLQFSPDGKSLITVADDGVVRFWNLADGVAKKELADFIPLGNAVFSPDGRFLATGAGDGVLRIWQIPENRMVYAHMANPGGVSELIFSPDGNLLASGGMDHLVRLWKSADGQPAGELAGSEGWINSLAFSPDGATLAASTTNGTVRLWSVAEGRLLAELDTQSDMVLRLAFSADGSILVTAAMDGSLKLWQLSDHQIQATFRDEGPFLSSLIISSLGEWLAAAGDDRRITLWSLPNGASLRILESDKKDGVAALAFSYGADLIAAAYWDQSLRIFNLADGKQARRIEFPADIRHLDLSAGGDYLALSLEDATVQIWGIK